MRKKPSGLVLGVVAGLLAGSLALASCAKIPEKEVKAPVEPPVRTDLHYQKTLTLTRETALGPATIYLALPEEGAQELWLYFHGAGTLQSSSVEQIRQFIPAGMAAPALAAVTFGDLWNLTDETEVHAFSSLELFWNDIVPLIEERTGSSVRKVGIGYSMGGFNLLSLFVDRPGYFDALVFMNPALDGLSPSADQKTVDAYVSRTKAYTRDQWIHSFFGGPRLDSNIRPILEARGRLVTKSNQRWEEVSPLARLERWEGRKDLQIPIFVAWAQHDIFGFAEGGAKLAELLGADPQLTVHPFDGGHLDLPVDAVAAFFARRNP